MPPKSSKRKAANGYKLPDPLPEGLILTGTNKKSWRLGKSIGLGGFGEIYLASEDTDRAVRDDATLALKIEPHENGPLFVEMNFYIRVAQPQMVEEFKKAHGLKSFGMPCLRGNGSHVHKGEKYRFLLMDRYGKDLQKIFQSGKKLFSDKVTYNLALKIIDVLEYIHSKGYVHNDIKAQNLLMGYGRTKENDVYLVDFGLVSKYLRDGVHYEYKPDARKAHDGTIEYTSRDAHIGAHSRRSDLEILGYNLVHWMSGDLPWMDNLTNPQYVQAQKKGYMNDIKAFLQRCFKSDDYPAVLEEFLNYVVKLEFDDEPDYNKCRKMFQNGLTKAKYPLDGKIDFTTPKKAAAAKKGRKRKKSEFEDTIFDFSEENSSCRKSMRNLSKNHNNENSISLPNGRIAPHPTPAASPTPEDMARISEWSWEKILCSDPELLIRQASRQSENEEESPLALQHRAIDERKQKESLKNPTEAMLEIMARIEQRERERENMTWQQQLQHFNKVHVFEPQNNPLTPAMEEVIKMRQKRISVEIDVPITPEPSDSETDSEEEDEEYVPPPPKMVKKANFVSNGRRDHELMPEEPKAKRAKLTRKAEKELHDTDPFEFHEEEQIDLEYESIGNFRSCLNVVNTTNNEQPDGKETTTTTTMTGKGRRISIQNDATPIRNKDSPGEKDNVAVKKGRKTGRPKKAAKGRGRKEKLLQQPINAKRLSSIPEEVFIESIQSVDEVKTARSLRARAVRKVVKQPPEPPVEAVEVKKNQRRNMRSNDASMRTTRAQDWKWENVLLSNPERILRRSKC